MFSCLTISFEKTSTAHLVVLLLSTIRSGVSCPLQKGLVHCIAASRRVCRSILQVRRFADRITQNTFKLSTLACLADGYFAVDGDFPV